MSLLAMSLGLSFRASRRGRTGGGGWVHPKGANSMAASGLNCKRHWVGHFSPPFHKMGLGVVFWPCRASISGSEALFSLCRGNQSVY